MSNWVFKDPPNLAVIIDRRIVHDGEWIAYVTHDFDDGSWQFHVQSDSPPLESNALILGLFEVLDIDPTIGQLADLPIGWHAWRASKNSDWERASNPDS